jgi:type VII secretion protein EccB
MASRSDQLHSHQFTLQRVVSALAMRDPHPVSAPLRRAGGALFASVMLAALAVAAVGVYGLLRPGGGESWRDGASVIVERETGARFVYRDGVLYPVVNYSSALLILGSASPSTALVSRAALIGVPRGTPLGIAGAPDLLPGARDLVAGPWTLCSRPAPSMTGTSAGVESVLSIGVPLGGPPEPIGARALVAADSAGGRHLIWANRRFPIRDPDIVMSALAWPREASVPVSSAVLNAVPAGTELGRITIRRTSKSIVDGYRVGEVVVVQNQSGGRRFGAVMPDGVADVTEVQAGLLLADGANGIGGDAKPMSQARYASAPKTASLVPRGEGAPPATAPELVPATAQSLCAAFGDAAALPLLSVASQPPRATGEVLVPAPVGDAGQGVDWIAVPPGRGAVVEALAGPASPDGALAFVSDLGIRFPVPSRELLAQLGYPPGQVTPARLPASLVALLPSGRALDPAAAGLPASSSP